MTVRQIQNLLQYLGYYAAAVDGISGPLTQQATGDFQRDFGGLDVTGALDEATREALRQAVGSGMPEQEKNGTFWDEIRYFTREEPGIACPCGRCGGFPAEPAERLMRNADAVRKHFGRPMIPSSTVRCDAHNASLKGSAANSLHKRGKAMDFAIPGVGAEIIVTYVRTLPDVDECYAIDGSYVHMGVNKYGQEAKV